MRSFTRSEFQKELCKPLYKRLHQEPYSSLFNKESYKQLTSSLMKSFIQNCTRSCKELNHEPYKERDKKLCQEPVKKLCNNSFSQDFTARWRILTLTNIMSNSILPLLNAFEV